MSTIITHRQFPGYHKYEMELAGRPLTLEVGKLAELANAAVMVGYGDTRVLVCATASARPRDGIDFLPLSVDFEEKRSVQEDIVKVLLRVKTGNSGLPF